MLGSEGKDRSLDEPPTSSTMNERPPKPLELKLLCLAYLAWALVILAGTAPQWMSASDPQGNGNWSMDATILLALFATIGLWRLWPAGRGVALFLSWFWLVASTFLFVQLFPMAHLTATSDFLAALPRGFLRVFIIPFFLAQIWQLRTLHRPHIRALFVRHPKPQIA
jgi:hypothetical protein